MKNDQGLPANKPSDHPGWRRLFGWPSTRLGWWSVALGVTFLVLSIINAVVFMPSVVVIPRREMILPFYGIAMILDGLAAGSIGLIAIIRRRERSLLVWLNLLPGLFVLALLLGEFLAPH